MVAEVCCLFPPRLTEASDNLHYNEHCYFNVVFKILLTLTAI